MGKNFLGNIILVRQVAIPLGDILPQLGIALHKGNDVPPFLRILLAHHLGPQMGVFMNRGLGSGNTAVNVYAAILTYKSIGLAIRGAEETEMPAELCLCSLLDLIVGKDCIGGMSTLLADDTVIAVTQHHLLESLTAIKRAGAQYIITYYAKEFQQRWA